MEQSLQNTAVIFIDIINDFNFERGERLLKHTKEILPHLKKLKRYAKDNKVPVIYVNDHYGLWQADYNKLINHCKNENSQEIIEEMQPDHDDYFLIKPKHSAFFQTPLESLLIELGKTNLILAGIAGDICILFTAKDAYMYEYSLRVPENCIASNEKKGNEYSLYLMRSVMDAKTDTI
ncbi:isochorismatase family cysteine hydrolase [Virgibacillus necropolis]|uniref:Isochorismatase n=1 Tax=Virgibacillus necropolis TaxID=163877 RepID=A0A221M811_9BACI|nr:isochorismatase family cysteine hydrolase [Virgibacillus necropolis]ASN03772.1 isochorismatase [Virgibacillus necropolis]